MLGIASNFDRRLGGLIENMPAFHPVRHLVISSEIGWRKPASEFFAHMCRQSVAKAEQILYVGDDPINDYEGASRAGMRSLLFAPRGSAAIRPGASLPSLRELVSSEP